jgi:hypothetical protein
MAKRKKASGKKKGRRVVHVKAHTRMAPGKAN